jgi:hypothetical protein
MNFKTTILLLVLLLIAGGVLFFTQQKSSEPTPQPQTNLLSLSAGDVTHVSIATDDNQHFVMEKTDGKWNLTEPVKAPAEEMTVNSLLDAISSLQTRGQVDLASAGVNQPHFHVELTTKDNKTIKLDVGDRSGAGDNLYVRVNDGDKADVVPTALYDQLDKPLKNWRRAKLFDVAAPTIKQLRIATTQQSFTLEKTGEKWQITQPTSMPAETSDVTDVAVAVANLQASDFADSDQPSRYGLDHPLASVDFSTQAQTTQPSTQPSFTTIRIGRFADVTKQNVYAMTSSEMGVAIVPATILDSLRKSPLDLRDRSVLAIDPQQVTKITINTQLPATGKPMPRPTSHQSIVIERVKRIPATTQASTRPVVAPSKWKLVGGADADDLKIAQLLAELNPLRVVKYLPTMPATTKPTSTYTITIETADASYELRLLDAGGEEPLIGSYNGLTFEAPRTLVSHLSGDFAKKATNETAGQKIDSVGRGD